MAGARFVVRVPDIGDFEDVEVVEVLVAPGDRVEAESSLITLESEKASLDVPSPRAGVVAELRVREGDRVSEGAEILVLEVQEAAREAAPAAPEESAAEESAAEEREPAVAATADPAPRPDTPRPAATRPGALRAASPQTEAPPREASRAEASRAEAPRAARTEAGRSAERLQADVLVLGGGPGGYTAAFRAADLGKRVVLVERFPVLGGVCLHVGCIPSKTLLHVAEVIHEAAALAAAGVEFGEPKLDLARLRARKDAVVAKLADGLAGLARRRRVHVVTGEGRFEDAHRVRVEGAGAPRQVEFENAIVAVGSRQVALSGLPDDPRVLDSTSALALGEVPRRLLVVGGGVIGLELATVYEALGSQVSVVELLPELLSGVDADLVRPLRRRIERRYEAIWCGTRLTALRAEPDALLARFEGPDAPAEARFDRVLVAVGRSGRGDQIGAERAGLRVGERGFLAVDAQQRTNLPHVFAIGDVTGAPLLAHRAMHQGKVAAEVIAGLPAAYDPAAVPSVAYTDPEIAWAGLGEEEAKQKGIALRKAVFPWAANARSLGLGRDEGLTKLLFSEESGRLLGAGIVGPRAGELIAEAVVAIELGADAEDLALSIHPHPTLSETLGLAAEIAAGTITDLLPSRKPGGRREPGSR